MAGRRPVVAGNWKMHLDVQGAAALARDVVRATSLARWCDVAVMPSAPLIAGVARVLEGTSVEWGGQDLAAEAQGAYTGDVSAAQLVSLGCRWVIVGHSERRKYHLEGDDVVKAKTVRALGAGLTPITCVGEQLSERKAGQTLHRIETQVRFGLGGLAPADAERVVIAYEPVWAIGTGETATPAQAEEVHEYIRRLWASMYGDTLAAKVRILYGGSVKASNAAELMGQKDVDGALVGGAALSANDFGEIVKAARV
ncbi:MAG: triose-phosphate isomerase [Deltaproteobacteria bacterium]|nr:triose-phosphate isomerase [Deltaproteobacteria bacterium]